MCVCVCVYTCVYEQVVQVDSEIYLTAQIHTVSRTHAHVHVHVHTHIYMYTCSSWLLPYSRKLLQVTTFVNWQKYSICGENFRGLPIRNVGWALLREKMAEKTFAEAGNTAKLAKIFTRESFRPYCIESVAKLTCSSSERGMKLRGVSSWVRDRGERLGMSLGLVTSSLNSCNSSSRP